MGDSGMAFIVQANRTGPYIDGALDVGWWPLDHFGTGLYVDFVGDALGWELAYTTGKWQSAETVYREILAPILAESLAAGRPALCHSQYQFVTAALDDGDPPLLGGWAVEHGDTLIRIDAYPWGMYAFGEASERLPREEADIAALQHAVDLRSEESPCLEGALTGIEAFALWAETLRDVEHIGQARWHGNMVRHLKLQRESAIAYLEGMAGRHEEGVAAHLTAAADYYQQVLDDVEALDLKGLESTPPPWEDVAVAVERMALLEGEAIGEIEAALAELGHEPGQE